MEAQNLSSQEQEGLAGEVMESLGEPTESNHEETHESEGEGEQDDLPKGVKERLARQERKHQREMKRMSEHVQQLQSHFQSQPNMDQSQNQMANPTDSGINTGGDDERIRKAVSYAFQHKDMMDRKAFEEARARENAQHYERQKGELNDHLDNLSDKYEDFDDVVRAPHQVHFTPAMRDVSLMLPKKGAGSAGEVLYKLGKNPSELERISKLHPLEIAREMVGLSHALISGDAPKSPETRILGQIKSNPSSSSHVVNDKTPVSDIRKRLKEGSL